MSKMSELHYEQEVGQFDQKGRLIPKPMKEGYVWLNPRDKNYYLKRDGKLILLRKGGAK